MAQRRFIPMRFLNPYLILRLPAVAHRGVEGASRVGVDGPEVRGGGEILVEGVGGVDGLVGGGGVAAGVFEDDGGATGVVLEVG